MRRVRRSCPSCGRESFLHVSSVDVRCQHCGTPMRAEDEEENLLPGTAPIDIDDAELAKESCPGAKINSHGQGKGLGNGLGHGPVGSPKPAEAEASMQVVARDPVSFNRSKAFTSKEVLRWLAEGIGGDDYDYEEVDLDRQPKLRRQFERGFKPTAKLMQQAARFEKEAVKFLQQWLKANPDKVVEDVDVDDFLDEGFVLSLYHSLNGEGAGLWDGTFDHLFTDDDYVNDMEKFLASRLRRYVDSMGGGSLNDALADAWRATMDPLLSGDSVSYASTDRLPGGLADNRPDSAFDGDALARGTKIEMEHTDDEALAQEIAKDHLAEHPDYYDEKKGLPAMEERLEKTGAVGGWKKGKVMTMHLVKGKKQKKTFDGLVSGNWGMDYRADEQQNVMDKAKGKKPKKLWHITHLPSGLFLARFPSKAAAQSVVSKLQDLFKKEEDVDFMTISEADLKRYGRKHSREVSKILTLGQIKPKRQKTVVKTAALNTRLMKGLAAKIRKIGHKAKYPGTDKNTITFCPKIRSNDAYETAETVLEHLGWDPVFAGRLKNGRDIIDVEANLGPRGCVELLLRSDYTRADTGDELVMTAAADDTAKVIRKMFAEIPASDFRLALQSDDVFKGLKLAITNSRAGFTTKQAGISIRFKKLNDPHNAFKVSYDESGRKAKMVFEISPKAIENEISYLRGDSLSHWRHLADTLVDQLATEVHKAIKEGATPEVKRPKSTKVKPSAMPKHDTDRENQTNVKRLGKRKTGTRRHLLLPKNIASKIPKLYKTENDRDPKVWVKFFSPYSNYTWLITEFDGKDRLFGYTISSHGGELGYLSLHELENATKMGGKLPLVERDLHFSPKPLSKASKDAGHAWTPFHTSSAPRTESGSVTDFQDHIQLVAKVGAFVQASSTVFGLRTPTTVEGSTRRGIIHNGGVKLLNRLKSGTIDHDEAHAILKGLEIEYPDA